MRIKFLSAIVSFLFVSFAVTACLDNNETPIEYSSDATIHEFSIDTILGVTYKFTIDQLKGEIYNQDSLPVGSDTIIDRVLIKKLSIAWVATYKNSAGEDTILNIADSMDLRKPIKIKVWAPDSKQTKEYSIEVRVHKQHPDSLAWYESKEKLSSNAFNGQQKAVLLNDQLLVFTSNTTLHKTSIVNGLDLSGWGSVVVTGLPSQPNAVLNFKNILYASTADGNLYYSDNEGTNWKKTPGSLSNNMVTLVAALSDELVGIRSVKEINKNGIEENVLRFCTTPITNSEWTLGDTVPKKFPLYNISSTKYNNSANIENVLVMGNIANPTKNDTTTVAWASIGGQTWADLTTDSKKHCPALDHPTIFRYNNAFYAFGKDFQTFYTSLTGITWSPVTKRFLFPAALRGKSTDYSMVVTTDNYIWLLTDQPNNTWRGRLNKYGFKRQ